MAAHKIIRLVAVGIIFISGPLFMMLLSPADLPIYLLVLPFIWLFSVLFWIIRKLLGRRTQLGGKQAFLISFLVAALPTLLLVLQSIQLLSVRDFTLLVGFTALGLVYLLRADFIR